MKKLVLKREDGVNFILLKERKRILLDKNLDVQSIDIDQAKSIYSASTNKKT